MATPTRTTRISTPDAPSGHGGDAVGGAPPASMFDEEEALKELKGELEPPAEVDTSVLTEEAKKEVEAGKELQQKYQAAAEAEQARRDEEARKTAERAIEQAKAALEDAKNHADEIGIAVAMETIRENMRLLETVEVKGPVNANASIKAVTKEGAKEYIETELTPDPVIVDQVRFSQAEQIINRDKKLGTVPVGLSTKPSRPAA